MFNFWAKPELELIDIIKASFKDIFTIDTINKKYAILQF